MTPIIEYFGDSGEGSDSRIRSVENQISGIAYLMDARLPSCAEKSAGMRKLLEAQDCFKRAALEEKRGVSS